VHFNIDVWNPVKKEGCMQNKIVVRYKGINDLVEREKVLSYLARRFKTNAATVALFLEKPNSKMRVVATREQADQEVARLKKNGIYAEYDGMTSIEGRVADFDQDDQDDEDFSNESMTCPKCGVYQNQSPTCKACHVRIEKYGRQIGSSVAEAAYMSAPEPVEETQPDYSFHLGEIQGLVNIVQVVAVVGVGYLLAKYLL